MSFHRPSISDRKGLMGSELQAELARLRRFMREPSRANNDDDDDDEETAAKPGKDRESE